MSIVGADQQVVFADAFGQQRNVFFGFAGHVESIVTEQMRARLILPLAAELSLERMKQIRNPTAIGFDEAEFETWKQLGNFVVDDIIEGEERQNCRVGPLPVSFEIEKVDERRATRPLVDADR